jgi:electron transport complex protein RnfB
MFKLAVINEDECIGCTKCIQACPFDAIIGASKQLHAVLNSECTGCELCIEPCPVDCITLLEIEKPLYDREKIKQRKKARVARLAKEKNHYAAVPTDEMLAKKKLKDLYSDQ